jgi:hypothetical protein
MVPIRPSSVYLLFVFVLFGLLTVSLLDTALVDDADLLRRAHNRQQVERFRLTDPALFTEARYTRHLSQADSHAPFQDHPMALEHFPSGSLVLPANSGHRP